MILISKVIYLIIFITIFVSVAIPLTMHQFNQTDTEDIKQMLNLSAKALINNIEREGLKLTDISMGLTILNDTEIEINREKLLEDFYDSLYKNINNMDLFEKTRRNIPVKVLVLYDRFFVVDSSDKWSVPYFFIHSEQNQNYYLNIRDTKAYYFEDGEEKETILEQPTRDKVIIERINAVVSSYTNAYLAKGLVEYDSESGSYIDTTEERFGNQRYTDKRLYIEIQNPTETNSQSVIGEKDISKINEFFRNRDRQLNFNVLDGITFFVVYLEEKSIDIRNTEIVFPNYNVVGYTLDIDRKVQTFY